MNIYIYLIFFDLLSLFFLHAHNASSEMAKWRKIENAK